MPIGLGVLQPAHRGTRGVGILHGPDMMGPLATNHSNYNRVPLELLHVFQCKGVSVTTASKLGDNRETVSPFPRLVANSSLVASLCAVVWGWLHRSERRLGVLIKFADWGISTHSYQLTPPRERVPFSPVGLR